MSDVITAVSTPIGVGGVAIIRLSGEGSHDIVKKMFAPSGKTPVEAFEPYKLYPGEIDLGGATDYGMAVIFNAPKSYTGEDMAELHCHGGVAITRGVLRRTVELGARPATRGEFTKRAFLSGKLSLSSCEGLADMINAESEGEVKAGYYLYNERLTREIRDLRQKLTATLASVDAGLDFPEEGVEEETREQIAATCAEVLTEIKRLTATYAGGRRVRCGVKVALVGEPNSGKSSLLNALTGQDRAIVSPLAGTTRDIVEGTVIIDGVRFILSDTAGMREGADGIEKEGIIRSKRALADADVAVAVVDLSKEAGEEEEKLLADFGGIVVGNKRDIKRRDFGDAEVSALTGEGLDELKKLLVSRVFGGKVDLSGDVISEERHFFALNSAADALEKTASNVNLPLDAAAVTLTEAWQYLGEITGETASEEIIDEIFSRFCVGK